jgi:hypothetical protein
MGLGLVHEEKEDLNKIFFNFVTALQILQDRVLLCMHVLAEVTCGRVSCSRGPCLSIDEACALQE